MILNNLTSTCDKTQNSASNRSEVIKCGSLSKNFNGREKLCDKCGYKINRDVNGARNILLKNAKQHIKLRL